MSNNNYSYPRGLTIHGPYPLGLHFKKNQRKNRGSNTEYRSNYENTNTSNNTSSSLESDNDLDDSVLVISGDSD